MNLTVLSSLSGVGGRMFTAGSAAAAGDIACPTYDND